MKRNKKRRAALPLVNCLESRAYLSTSFGAPTFFGGMDNVTGIAVGALTTSGKQDIVVSGDAPGTTNTSIGVYLNKGGTYGTPTLIPYSGTPGAVAMGDFLGNGKMDVVALDGSNGSVSEFLNDGAGNFSPGVGAGGMAGETSITAADFNGDGPTDLAIADPTMNTVNVLINGRTQFGSFVGGASISVPLPTKVIAADVSGDGKPDLVILSSANPSFIYIAINDGTGNFTTATPYSVGDNVQNAADVAVADFNADGHPDLVALASQSGNGTAAVLINQGNGIFNAATENTVPSAAALLGTGNFSNTGGTDIAAISSTGGLDILAHGGAVGTFQADQPIFTTQLGVPGAGAVFADLNGDGLTDVAYLSPANNGFGVSLNTTGGTVVPPPVTGTNSVLTPTVTGALPATPLVAGTKLKPIHEKVVINNSSASAVIGAVKIEIVLSAGTTPAVGDLTVATITRKLRFNAHQSKSFVLTVNSLPASAGGTYHLVARVTDPTLLTNTAASSATISVVPPTIDLSGAFVAVPASARIGHPIATTLAVTNSGSIATNKRLEIKVYVSQSGIIDSNAIVIADSFRGGPIRPGKPVKIHISKALSRTMPAGMYFVTAQLDPANVFNDTNVSNNTFVSQLKVAVT